MNYRRALNRQALLVPKDDICVNYGGAPTEAELIHGGRVKLSHLSVKFHENLERFNILYLVSSALPPYPEELAKWAKKSGAKLVLNQNGVAYPAWAGERHKLINDQLGRILHLADYVIYQSEFCKQSADRYLGISEAPYQVLYNCVDTQEFVPVTNKKPTEPWILLAAGTHQQYERVKSVLETVSQLRMRGRYVRLILAGKLDFPLSETRYNDLVREFNAYEWVERLPPFSKKAARELYRRAHVLLHPKYKDPCPTVVIEAMSSGVPVVGSKSGGMAELVGSDAGVLIEVPESWHEMHVPGAIETADAVELLMRDWLPKSRAARRRAELFYNKEDWLDRHAQIFESLLRPE